VPEPANPEISETSVEIFCSYSHAKPDEALRVAFAKSMSLWVRKKVMQIWHDGRNLAGDDWASNIDEHLNSADIVVLLVSPDFLSSDFCYVKEMGRALERMKNNEALVVPIIVRPCSWKETPLADIQALPDKGKAVTLWTHRDVAWQNVAESLARRAREVLDRKIHILLDQQEAAKIYRQIARDAAANAQKRQRIMADLQAKIFDIDQTLKLNRTRGTDRPYLKTTDAFNAMDKYIRDDSE
jgi:predicted nucleotide-binding protein